MSKGAKSKGWRRKTQASTARRSPKRVPHRKPKAAGSTKLEPQWKGHANDQLSEEKAPAPASTPSNHMKLEMKKEQSKVVVIYMLTCMRIYLSFFHSRNPQPTKLAGGNPQCILISKAEILPRGAFSLQFQESNMT